MISESIKGENRSGTAGRDTILTILHYFLSVREPGSGSRRKEGAHYSISTLHHITNNLNDSSGDEREQGK